MNFFRHTFIDNLPYVKPQGKRNESSSHTSREIQVPLVKETQEHLGRPWFSKCDLWSPGGGGVPDTLSGGPQEKNYFHNDIKIFASLHTDICTDDIKAIVDRFHGALMNQENSSKRVVVGFFTSTPSL